MNSDLFSSTMPELHINGRIPYHNSSIETNDIGARYYTSSSMITGRSYNLTSAIETTTNTLDSENSFGVIVFFIFCVCLALATMILIVMWLIRKRQNKNTRKSSIQRVLWNEASIASQFHANLILNKHHINNYSF